MSDVPFTAIDHVQLAMPIDGEPIARQFYGNLLGMVEIPKPLELAKRGGRGSRAVPCRFTLESNKTFVPPEKRILRSGAATTIRY